MYLNQDDKILNNTQTSSASKNTSKDKKKDNYKSDVDKTIEEGDKLIAEAEKLEERYKSIKLGQDVSVDKVLQFKINSNQWADSIVPSNTSKYYFYKEDEEGKSYYLLKGTIKNLSNSRIDIYTGIYAAAKFNDNYNYNYNYSVSSQVEDVDKNSFDDYLDPLEERTWYLYVSVSDEVKNTFKNVDIKIAFKDTVTYVSSDEDCNNFYKISLQFRGDIK